MINRNPKGTFNLILLKTPINSNPANQPVNQWSSKFLLKYSKRHVYCYKYNFDIVLNDNDWVKKHMEYEVEGAKPRGRPKKTWREIVE